MKWSVSPTKRRPREPEGSEGFEEDEALKITMIVEHMKAAAVMSCTKIHKESMFFL